MRQELISAIESIKWNELLSFQQESENLMYSTLNMDTAAVAAGIEKIHTEYDSAIQYIGGIFYLYIYVLILFPILCVIET